MKKLIKKILKSKYSWMAPLLEIIILIGGIFWIGYCIDTHQWIMLVNIIILFIAKCYFITSIVFNNFSTIMIKASNHNSLSCPKCHKQTLEYHDYHYYGSEINCTTCGHTIECR